MRGAWGKAASEFDKNSKSEVLFQARPSHNFQVGIFPADVFPERPGRHRQLRCRGGGRMTKKWYNYFVSVDDPNNPGQGDPSAQGSPSAGPAPAGMSAAQTVAQIAANVTTEPKFSAPVSNANS